MARAEHSLMGWLLGCNRCSCQSIGGRRIVEFEAHQAVAEPVYLSDRLLDQRATCISAIGLAVFDVFLVAVVSLRKFRALTVEDLFPSLFAPQAVSVGTERFRFL